MKKLISLILGLTALVAFTACSGVMKVNPDNLNLNKAYEFKADITFSDFTAKAELKRKNENSWEIALLEPYALNGLVYTYQGGRITAEFGGLVGDFSGNAQSDAIYKLIADAFENAFCGTGGKREAVATKTEYRVSGKVNDYAYELTFDKKSKVPLSISIPDIGMSAQFSEADTSDIAGMFMDPNEQPLDEGIVLVE